MARAETSILDGLEVGYGTRDSFNIEDAEVHTLGRIRQHVVRVDHTTIANLATGVVPSSKVFEFPTGAAHMRSKLVVEESFADLTSIIVGTKRQSDGITVDDDGFFTTVLLAALTADAVIEGSGAFIDGDRSTAPAVVSLDVTGTPPTAGELVLVFEYLEPYVSQASPAIIVGEI